MLFMVEQHHIVDCGTGTQHMQPPEWLLLLLLLCVQLRMLTWPSQEK
jgi:hypothetical protein